VVDRGPRPLGSYAATATTAVALAGLVASGQTDLQLISPLVWVMLGLTVAGALITYAFMVYAVWRFRDRTTRGRRHG
jgi:amino acid transporter